MIYTITPNPALDLNGTVEKIVPNEKTYVHHETRFPGGNAINAARMIKKFGQPVIASGFLGGEIGKEVTALLKHEGIRCQFIQIQNHTRINITVSTQKTHLQTRFSFPGPQIQAQEIHDLNQWIQKLTFIHSHRRQPSSWIFCVTPTTHYSEN
jgi:fructose-1-phosphate kinase PfkB-like protein